MAKNIRLGLGALVGMLLLRNLYVILFNLPDEMEQGPIYRIFYYHLPAFFAAILCYITALVASSMYLIKKNLRYDAIAMSATEVGLAFAAVNLITGMIWGRISWGIWWAWDARLTWALICWLVYFGYLMLRQAIDDPTERAKNSAVLSIFAFVSVAITYKAIEWWRTQHPGPVLSIRTGKQLIDPVMENMLYMNFLALATLAVLMVIIRLNQEEMQRQIDGLRRRAHAI
ncbi:MAG: cytochrome c biogenesis protein CcsA [Acidobacteria bacterium]|jgi:heme exporter protein C|nr:cytochrome c biogenesis protein CcsA [Acidobacteriota bacterium]